MVITIVYWKLSSKKWQSGGQFISSSLWIACHQPTGWTVINVDSSSNTMVTITRPLQPQEPVSRHSWAGLGLAPTVTLQRFVCLYQNMARCMRILSRRQKHVQYFQFAERFCVSNFHRLLPMWTGVNHSLLLFWGPYGTTTKCETNSVLQDLC